MKLSRLDLALCVVIPILLFFLGFISNSVASHDKRIRTLEQKLAAVDQHLVDLTRSVSGLSFDIKEMLRHERDILEKRSTHAR